MITTNSFLAQGASGYIAKAVCITNVLVDLFEEMAYEEDLDAESGEFSS